MLSNRTVYLRVLLGLTLVGLLPFVGCSSSSAVDPTTLVGTTPVAGVAAGTFRRVGCLF